ncbi:MAG: hypothetical protein EBZ47_04820 [Chlamydiae bacterium]|nr:hypothetical protein [Chlamydiota bacterium]
MKNFKHKISYIALCILFFPLRFFSYKFIHSLGNTIGAFIYYVIPLLRKRSLGNLALATDLKLDNQQIQKYAKESIQNLVINCLEIEKLSFESDVRAIATCENPHIALDILKQEKGIVFFCGHQANWEVLFLDASSRMQGGCIGKELSNPYLYQKLLKTRQKFGGKVLTPKNASTEALNLLKHKKFIGIVGDLAILDSGYCSNFLGRNAWSSPLPALLAFKTNSPIIVLSCVRKNGHYFIKYSDPIWPDKSQPRELEIQRLMNTSIHLLCESIKENPGQWLWSLYRWKQKHPGKIFNKYRIDCLGMIIPQAKDLQKDALELLILFRKIYQTEYFILFAPKNLESLITIPLDDIIFYEEEKECVKDDYRIKFLIDLSNNPSISRHYKKLSAVRVLTLKDIAKALPQKPNASWEDKLNAILIKPSK